MKALTHTCSACGLGALVIASKIVRACGHDSAPVVAHAASVMSGSGKVRQ